MIYKLHSVLVHYGDIHGGHYYSFVRPDCESAWFKFNDELVSKSSSKAAVDDNFGYSSDDSHLLANMRKTESLQKRLANAYMLVYVRASHIPTLLKPLTIEDIPAHLKERFEKEDQDAKEAPYKMKVCLVTDEILMKHRDADFVHWDICTWLSVMKNDTIARLKHIISEVTGCPVARQRLWTMHVRQNGTTRVDRPLEPDEDDVYLAKFVDNAKTSKNTLRIYMEQLPPGRGDGAVEYEAGAEALISLKYFNAQKQQLQYMGSLIVARSMLVGSLVEVVEKKLNIGKLNVYEEIQPSKIEEPDPSHSLEQAKLNTGDILVFEKDVSSGSDSDSDSDSDRRRGETDKARRTKDVGSTCMCRTVPQYYNYLQHRVNVRVRRLESPDKDMFTIELSTEYYYKQVAYLLAERMHKQGFLSAPIDPLRIQLYRHHQLQDRPSDSPAERSASWQLQNLVHVPLNYNINHKECPILYVEILAYSLTDLERNFLLKIRCPPGRKVRKAMSTSTS